MQFKAFFNKINKFRPIFTLSDLRVIFADDMISSKQLNRWQESSYVLKLKNGVYLLQNSQEDIHPFLVANLLYQPSYVSLESALYEYGFIPDVPQAITSVSSKKTWNVDVLETRLSYRKIKTECFIGYTPKKYKNREVLIAEPEKALVDFCYLNNSVLRNDEQIDELRLNYEELKLKIDKQKFTGYAKLFDSRILDKIIEKIKNRF